MLNVLNVKQDRLSSWLVGLGFLAAIAVHGGFILFGGFLFLRHPKDYGTLQQVELLSEDDIQTEKKDIKPPEDELKKAEDLNEEPPPNPEEIIRQMELESVMNNVPALDAVSLSAIEAALSGQATAGGDFAQSLSFSSGGRIGGLGQAGLLEDKNLDEAFSLAEIDQKPQAVVQSAPNYPAGLKGKKSEDVVTVIFVVDASGKVVNPKAEKSTDPAFNQAAIDAVKRWKFEPAIRAGQRVACKMRVPIRFQPKGS